MDENNKISDAFFGSEKALERSEREYQLTQRQGSPSKGAHVRVPATIVKGLKDGIITVVRTEDGKEKPYQIRPLALEKLGNLLQGDKVILLIDNEEKVIDIAAPEKVKG